MKKNSRSLLSLVFLLAACLPFASFAQDAPSKEQQLKELEKELSYQTIREYIDYAEEDPIVFINVRKGFPDYVKTVYGEDRGTPTFKASDKVEPRNELNSAWALYNVFAQQHSAVYIEMPGARELEEAAKKKEISRTDYNKQSGVIRREVTEDPDQREIVQKMLKASREAERKSLKIIFEDYVRLDKPIPTDWIPESVKKSLEKSARVKDIKKKIAALN